MTDREIRKHRREIIRKLRAGANTHEIMARSINGDDEAMMYHMDIANVMREAARMLEGT